MRWISRVHIIKEVLSVLCKLLPVGIDAAIPIHFAMQRLHSQMPVALHSCCKLQPLLLTVDKEAARHLLAVPSLGCLGLLLVLELTASIADGCNLDT